MATSIAISGKGGSGKTTLAAMIIRYLLTRSGKGAVLAVDADPNACLGLTLGIQPDVTIADIREDARAKPACNSGIDRLRTFEYGIGQAIIEASGFDLLTMGRPEGPDCYCAVNNMLRRFLDQLSSQYQYVIIDNEAGMEHLSRRTTNNVDLLCIVAEQSPLGALAARRIFELAKRLPISVKQVGVIWNKIGDRGQGSEISDQYLTSNGESRTLNGVQTLGYIPMDPDVFAASMQGKTIFDLEGDSPAFFAVQKILTDKILNLMI
jgi:CO dehydrogenase maturation factor